MLLQNNGAAFLAGLVLGGLVGTSVALLLAPQPGQETRAQLRTRGYELKDLAIKRCQDAGHRAQEQMVVWQEKGQEAFEKGQHRVVEVLGHGKDNLMHTLSLSRETPTESIASAAEQPI